MSPDTDLKPYEIPDIYVSEPHYDDMGEILDQIDVSYRNPSEVDPDRVTDAVMMINCGSDYWGIDADTFGAFVERGGSAIVSDWAGRLLRSFTDASFDSSTESTTLSASVEDNELAELLGKQELSLEFDMSSWYKPDSVPQNSTPLLSDAMTGDVLAYKFEYGDGEIVYTAFHNHAQTTEVEKALLKLLLMIPIADSSGTTLKDTYTTITGETVATGDTVIKEPSSESEETTVDKAVVTFDIKEGGTIERVIGIEGSARIGREDVKGELPDGDAKYISRTHVEIRHIGPEQLKIRDADSANGTKLNGNDISNGDLRTLSDGAQLDLAEGTAEMTIYIDHDA